MRWQVLLFWSAAVAAVWVGVLLVLRYDPLGLLVPCPLRSWTGIPCPTCRGVRAVRLLLGGDLLGALEANPLVVLLGAVLLGSGVAALILLPWAGRLRLPRRPRQPLLLGLIGFGVLVANWFYLLLSR